MPNDSKKTSLILSKQTDYGLLQVRIDAETLAQSCHVSLKTALRWCRTPDSLPVHMRELLEFKQLGTIQGDLWAGWRFAGGKLWSDTDTPHTPSQIDSQGHDRHRSHAMTRLVKTLESDNKRLEAIIKDLASAAGRHAANDDT